MSVLLMVLASVAVLLTSCSSSSSVKKSGNERIDRVLEQASKLEGTPYCYAGSTPDCFDCSGFVGYCFATIGVDLPRTTRELYQTGTRVVDGLQFGDLLFFNTSGKGVSHVGIFVGNNSFIHASTSSGVMVSPLTDRYWQPRYLGARRLAN